MEWRWLVDNALNFAPYVTVLAFAAAAYAVFGRQWPLAILSLLIVVGAGGYMVRSDALLARAHDCGAVPRLRIATFNVQAGAADLQAFAQFTEERGIHVVVLQEMTFDASLDAGALYDRYPHRAASSPRWIEILSTVPLADVGSYHVFGQSEERRVWQARLSEPFEAELYFLHAQNSRSALLHSVRIGQFQVLDGLLASGDLSAIVAGDMNATVLDPSFAGLLHNTGLRSAIAGRRDSPSWPSSAGPLGLRIDHVLQRGFEVCDVTVGPGFGSDHRPVVVELAEAPPG